MRRIFSRLWVVAVVLALAFIASTALAGGTFKLRTSQVQEVSGGWHVYFSEIALTKAPAIAHPTLRFLFTKTMVYERDLVDNNPNPVINRMALVGQNPSVEALEVDFSNPSGEIFPRTRFDFSLTRTRGYEAGEYKLQVRDPDGNNIGSPVTIILNGDNPVVDRRAMNFDSKNPNMKKIAATTDAGGPAKVDESVAAAPINGDVSPAGSAPPFLTNDAFQKQPEELAQHPKGCGCEVAGLSSRQGPWALGLSGLALGLVVMRGKRRKGDKSLDA